MRGKSDLMMRIRNHKHLRLIHRKYYLKRTGEEKRRNMMEEGKRKKGIDIEENEMKENWKDDHFLFLVG